MIREELMPVAWYPNRWWDFWWEKNEIDSMFNEL